MRFLRCYLLISLILFALPAQAQDDDGLTIGFLPVGSESAWRVALYENVQAEAERRGIHLLVYDGASEESFFYGFRDYVEQRVDAILLSPRRQTGWEDVLQEAKAAGIPVVILDLPITADESLYLTRVSSDFVDQGRLAGAWLAQATSGSCTIVELEGTVGSQAAVERQTGFNDVIALFPKMQIVASLPGDFMKEGGKTAMQTILSTVDPTTICAVWAQNDDMALGAIEAIKEAGLDPGDDMLIVSIDAIPDMLKVIADGDANATVELSSQLAGPAFDAIEAYFAGETVPKWIPVRGGIFTQETAYASRTTSTGIEGLGWDPNIPSMSGKILFTSLDGENPVIKVFSFTDEQITQLTSGQYRSYDPVWSPDGKQIAFVSNRDGQPDIYTMLADGSNVRRITNNLSIEAFPSWSPFGDQLVYQVTDENRTNAREPQLYITVLETLESEQLTEGSGGYFDPDWSPGWGSIAFISARDGQPDIYSLSLDDMQSHRLTDNVQPDSRTEDYDPSWSPDGRHITFYSFRDQSWEIYVMDVDEQKTYCVTCGTQIGGKSPTWSPNGSAIAFIDSDGRICIIDVINGETTCLENTEALPESWNLDWSF
jgi:simple sugar transport system substrate-binding protein